ncbi:hypothetical protein HDV00_011010 [Rhizophlyctis rosea]|nr:hypothetical protein HDV00_011010 [Rhizophlyctis rosea]
MPPEFLNIEPVRVRTPSPPPQAQKPPTPTLNDLIQSGRMPSALIASGKMPQEYLNQTTKTFRTTTSPQPQPQKPPTPTLNDLIQSGRMPSVLFASGNTPAQFLTDQLKYEYRYPTEPSTPFLDDLFQSGHNTRLSSNNNTTSQLPNTQPKRQTSDLNKPSLTDLIQSGRMPSALSSTHTHPAATPIPPTPSEIQMNPDRNRNARRLQAMGLLKPRAREFTNADVEQLLTALQSGMLLNEEREWYVRKFGTVEGAVRTLGRVMGFEDEEVGGGSSGGQDVRGIKDDVVGEGRGGSGGQNEMGSEFTGGLSGGQDMTGFKNEVVGGSGGQNVTGSMSESSDAGSEWEHVEGVEEESGKSRWGSWCGRRSAFKGRFSRRFWD